jgi:hypothetical protein
MLMDNQLLMGTLMRTFIVPMRTRAETDLACYPHVDIRNR